MPLSSWSTTAATNATADSASSIVWSEGQAPATVNDSARAMMAEIKKYYNQAENIIFASTGAWSGPMSAVMPTSIPAITNGTQVLTGSITPSLAASRVLIRISCPVTNTAAGTVGVALFRSTVTNAIAVDYVTVDAANYLRRCYIEFVHSPATTSAVTYTLRVGPVSGGNAIVNGDGTGGLASGLLMTTMTLQEIV